MNKLIIAALIGLLIFTACDEDTKDVDNETVLETALKSEDNIINLNELNISSIKIKDLSSDQESILIKDGIVREFRDFLKGMGFTKTDELSGIEYEAEIFDGGESALKISFTARTVAFSEKVMLGNTVIEKGNYEVTDWISQYIQHFYEGKVLDPQHIEPSANIYLPEAEFKLEMVERGNSKINQHEVYSKLYDFGRENFCNRNFEIVEYERIYDYELMEQYKQSAMKNYRAVIIENLGNYIKIDSDYGYDSLISASNIILAEYAEKPGIYRLYNDKAVVDIKPDDKFVRDFEDIFNINAKVSKDLTPDEIEVLFNEKTPYYMDYICKNLGIESWQSGEPIRLEKHKKSLNSREEPYTVLELYNNYNLRLLFFKEDKFIDYIDFGHKFAGTEYRLEKAGDKIFIAGRRCRNHGTGVDRNFEEWYILSEQGKKLVISFPYSDFIQPPYGGHDLTANSIKFNTNGDISLTVDYKLRKFYLPHIDINYEYGQEIEGTKKVVFKWDDEKSVFASEYSRNDIGMIEIPPESDDITEKCTDLLKKKYQQFTELILSFPEDIDGFEKENMKDSWKYFLNDCKDCDEKSALLEILDEK